jgi:hypothetical protein
MAERLAQKTVFSLRASGNQKGKLTSGGLIFHILIRAWQFRKPALRKRLMIGMGAMFLPLIFLSLGALDR